MVMLALLASAALAATPAPAAAVKCDAKALQKQIATTSPTAVPALYGQIVTCDPAVGKTAAPEAFAKIIPGEGTNEAMTAALSVGAGDAVRAWITKLQSDQQSPAIGWLGDQCKADPHAEQFFVDANAAMGADFWKQRWFKGLNNCQTPKIRDLLAAEIAKEAKDGPSDKSAFLAIVETFARNQGAAALDTMDQLVGTLKDEDLVTYVVSAYADAANVGGAGGTNVDASAKAVARLVALGPKLPVKSIDQARTTLQALGADQAADGMAAYRWPERKVKGNYTYAAIAIEDVTCKNGKKQGYFHSAAFTEAGKQWPEELKGLVGDKLEAEWNLHDADKCKGTGTVTYDVPGEPFKDDAAEKAWVDAAKKAFHEADAAYDKASDVPHPPFGM